MRRVFSQLAQSCSDPRKALMSTRPSMPGIRPVPVYCQNCQSRPGCTSDGWPAVARSQNSAPQRLLQGRVVLVLHQWCGIPNQRPGDGDRLVLSGCQVLGLSR